MEHLQMTFDDFLSYLDQNRAAQEDKAQPVRLSASSQAEPGGGYYCFGSYTDTINPSSFSPDAAYMLEHYPVLRYYLDHRYLKRDAIIDVYGSGARYTILAGDMYEAMEQETGQKKFS